MTQQEFILQLTQSKVRAKEISDILPTAPEDSLTELVREFIACKYFLAPEEMITDNLLQLGDLSTEKMANLKKGGLQYADKNAGCTTAGSSTIKKVLLAMALGKAIHRHLDADSVAYAETIPQLAQIISEARRGDVP